jgi:hypothetical protein
MKILSFLVFLLLFNSPISYAEEKHTKMKTDDLSNIESLSPELRELLKKEMNALQKGIISIIPAYISGDWKEIEDISLKMKNSYILKQNITEKQMKELHSSLPNEFIKKDKEFHYLAGMLNHAAKNKKIELISFYFAKLGESCVSCHSQYATHRFPKFALKQEESKAHSH